MTIDVVRDEQGRRLIEGSVRMDDAHEKASHVGSPEDHEPVSIPNRRKIEPWGASIDGGRCGQINRTCAKGVAEIIYNPGFQSICLRVSCLLITVHDKGTRSHGRDFAAALGWARRRGFAHSRRGAPGDGEPVVRPRVDQSVLLRLPHYPVRGRKKADRKSTRLNSSH